MSFHVAESPEDRADVRRLLRENPMGGDVSLSIEDKGDAAFFPLATTTILARDDAGRAIATGSVAVRDAYVTGQVRRVGYLGQLRLDQRCRPHPSVIVSGYQFLRGLLPTLGADLYFTSIAADNAPARRLLERGLPGMPIYRPLDEFVTSLFPVQGVRMRIPDLRVDGAGDEHIGEILDCLNRNGRRFNLFPAWSEAEVKLRIEADEFFIATRNGRVVGCMAAWDQSACKQTVIRGYSPGLSRWRHLLNAIGPMLRKPYLPPIGTALNLMYLSHVAADDDDPQVFAALLRYGCSPIDRWFGKEKQSYFVLGLPARHPLSRLIPRRFRRHTYRTQLYVVDWQDGHAPEPDDRPCQPEVALL